MWACIRGRLSLPRSIGSSNILARLPQPSHSPPHSLIPSFLPPSSSSSPRLCATLQETASRHHEVAAAYVHAMAQEDFHLGDAGLALGLSLGGGRASDAAHHSSSNRQGREAPVPSLTLSMPDEETATGTASGGGGGARSVSSLSVKRERAGEAEVEKASSTEAARGGGEDDDDGSTRKKLRLTKEQSALLEDRFKEHSTLNPKQKVALAKQLNLRPRQVEVWFQNRRARTKLKQTEVDCEFLKRCCETLTEENRRLQRELQELRALKHLAPQPQSSTTPPASPAPFYMQLPAATLTICPSCDRLGGGPATAAKADPDRPKATRTTHHFFNPFTHSAAC